MPNLALCVLTGHLGEDAETSFLPNGKPVCRFSLAVTTGYGEHKLTTWWRCTLWGDRGEKLAPMLAKGKPVTVVGEPSMREWTGNEGRKSLSAEVNVRDVVLLGSKDDRAAPAAAESQPAEDVPF